MVHGISGYFLERARSSRRLALLTLGVSLAALGMLGLAHTPPLRNAILSTERFGFEGPEQYVRRITLQQVESHSDILSDVGEVAPRVERRGGAEMRRSKGAEGEPVPRTRALGPGLGDQDLVLRSVSRSANVPVVRSEDLVIDRLVRPEYPARLLEENIEGKVMLQALVDTVGRVIDVQVLASTGEPLFERAAEEAVWQCRFRPYRPVGAVASEVYAVFRFAFRIY